MKDSPSAHIFPPRLIGLLVALTLGWGLNWAVMKVVLSEMPPMHFRAVCLVSAGGGLLAIARAGRLRTCLPAAQWPRLAAIALVNMGGWNIFAIYGLQLLASGRAAILGYTMPAWSVPLSTLLLREPLTRRRILGVVLACSGMLLLFGGEIQAVGRSPVGALLMMSAAFSWALGTVLMKRWPVELPTTSFTGWQMLVAAIPILTAALATEQGHFNFFRLSFWPMLGVIYNVLIAFIFCYWAWTKIATLAPVGVASLAVMMTPVVGVFSGMLLLGERPPWQDYAALLLVVASLATVLRAPRAARTPASDRAQSP